MMRVFTHFDFVPEAGMEGVRWRTLLKFGDSWEVKGSAVMKNPGAAKFKYADRRAVADWELLCALRAFDDGGQTREWYEFCPDPTMYCIGDLFGEYYSFRNERLDGVVQIFNLFYLREADLKKALAKAGRLQPGVVRDMTDYDLACLKMPVYLGFGNLARNEAFKEKAEKYFYAAKRLGMTYLSDNFQSNDYLHPLYLMRYGRNKDECVRTRERFIGSV